MKESWKILLRAHEQILVHQLFDSGDAAALGELPEQDLPLRRQAGDTGEVADPQGVVRERVAGEIGVEERLRGVEDGMDAITRFDDVKEGAQLSRERLA